MSLGDDYIADTQFEHDFPFGVPSDIWHSRHGDIKVSEMSTMHIKNCMNMVGEDDGWYAVFQKELKRRAEND